MFGSSDFINSILGYSNYWLCRDQETRPSDQQDGPGPSTAEETRPSDQQEGPGPSTAKETRPVDQQEGPEPFTFQETKRPGEFEASQQQVSSFYPFKYSECFY